jgi:16S rRNA (uracil1498-N3)-methyltransferase
MRFFHTLPPTLSLPCEWVIDDPNIVQHARQSLRLRPGEAFELVDRGRLINAELVRFDMVTMRVRLLEEQLTGIDPMPPVTVAMALIREERWRWMVQKVTEIGVHRIVPLVTERTIVQVSDPLAKQKRWQAVAQAAAEQSEGLFIPEVTVPVSVVDFARQATGFKVLLLERAVGREPLKHVLPATTDSLNVVIGPEGGWTDAEIATFKEAGFVAASLGQRVLRSETAAMAFMGAVACHWTQPD